MVKDYQQLWKAVVNASNEAQAVRTLTEIVADSAGRAFALRLEPKDAVLCIEALDYGIAEWNLETADRNNFFLMLRRLTEYHGRLPDRMMITEHMEVSDQVVASGGFGDVRTGKYMGGFVAVKTAKVTMRDDLNEIKKQFYKEVLLWERLSHPNILKLVGVQVDMQKGQFVTVSEWMMYGNIVEFITKYSANRLQLLHEVAQGLKYLHDLNLTHGDLKGANILMSNDMPPRACLADFGFTTTVLGPGQQNSCSAQFSGGTTMFLSPELLMPEMFGNKNAMATPEADVYAFAYVVFQVLTGEMPFRRIHAATLAFFVVLQGRRPEKPKDALAIGFSNSLWGFIQRCWDGDMKLRPKVGEVAMHLGEAAAKWGRLMPPHGQPGDVAPDLGEEWSGSMRHDAIFESGSTVVPESPTESQTTSDPFSRSSTLSTRRTEPPPDESRTDVSRLFEGLQLGAPVPTQREPEEPRDDLRVEERYPHLNQHRNPPPLQLPQKRIGRKVAKFLELLGLRR